MNKIQQTRSLQVPLKDLHLIVGQIKGAAENVLYHMENLSPLKPEEENRKIEEDTGMALSELFQAIHALTKMRNNDH